MPRSPGILARLAVAVATLLAVPRALAQETADGIPVQSLPSDAAAEMQEATPSVQLDAVVVTADKLGRREGQGNDSVRVVTAKELDQANARDLYDVLKRVGNVAADDSKSAQRGGFAIRGIVDSGPGSDGIGSSAPLASVYLDGAVLTPQGYAGGAIDSWDLAQVEVLRGPQSTTQGRNSLAGALVLRTQDPTPDWELQARGQTGELRSSQLAVAGGGPLVDGRLAVRGSYSRLLDRGAVSNATRGRSDADASDGRRGRAKLRWTPALLDSGWLQLGHSESTLLVGDQVVNRERAQRGERVSVSSEDEYARYGAQVDTLEIERPVFEAGRATAVTGRSHATRYQQYDFNRSARPDDGLFQYFSDEDALSQELRYRHRGERWRWVAGAYGSRSDEDLAIAIRDAVITVTEGVEVVLDADIASRQKKDNAALFGEAEYPLTPRWTLIAGGRYDHERVRFDYAGEYRVPRGSIGGVPVPGTVVEPLVDASGALPPDTTGEGTRGSDVLLPKLGTSWEFLPGQHLGLTLQRAYRGGGVSINPVRGTIRGFDPEFTNNAELSWRGEWPGTRLRSRLNVFYIDWRDQQVDVALSGNPLDTQTENAGRSRLYGGELELRWRAVPRLEVFLSGGTTRTRFLDFTSSDGSNFEGREFPNAPRLTATVGGAWKSAAGWFLDLDANYQAGSYRRPDNHEAERNEGRSLLNARTGWENRQFTAFLAGRNLTDAYYVSGKAGNGAVVGEPRLLSGGVEWRWQ